MEQAFVVSVSTSGMPADGHAVGTTEVQPGRSIYIAGPQSVINIINQVVATVNVGGLREDTTLASTLRVYDKNGDELNENQLNSLEFKDTNGVVINDRSVNVKVDLWRTVTDVALSVKTQGTPAPGYQIAGVETVPSSVSLREQRKPWNGWMEPWRLRIRFPWRALRKISARRLT